MIPGGRRARSASVVSATTGTLSSTAGGTWASSVGRRSYYIPSHASSLSKSRDHSSSSSVEIPLWIHAPPNMVEAVARTKAAGPYKPTLRPTASTQTDDSDLAALSDLWSSLEGIQSALGGVANELFDLKSIYSNAYTKRVQDTVAVLYAHVTGRLKYLGKLHQEKLEAVRGSCRTQLANELARLHAAHDDLREEVTMELTLEFNERVKDLRADVEMKNERVHALEEHVKALEQRYMVSELCLAQQQSTMDALRNNLDSTAKALASSKRAEELQEKIKAELDARDNRIAELERQLKTAVKAEAQLNELWREKMLSSLTSLEATHLAQMEDAKHAASTTISNLQHQVEVGQTEVEMLTRSLDDTRALLAYTKANPTASNSSPRARMSSAAAAAAVGSPRPSSRSPNKKLRGVTRGLQFGMRLSRSASKTSLTSTTAQRPDSDLSDDGISLAAVSAGSSATQSMTSVAPSVAGMSVRTSKSIATVSSQIHPGPHGESLGGGGGGGGGGRFRDTTSRLLNRAKWSLNKVAAGNQSSQLAEIVTFKGAARSGSVPASPKSSARKQ